MPAWAQTACSTELASGSTTLMRLRSSDGSSAARSGAGPSASASTVSSPSSWGPFFSCRPRTARASSTVRGRRRASSIRVGSRTSQLVGMSRRRASRSRQAAGRDQGRQLLAAQLAAARTRRQA